VDPDGRSFLTEEDNVYISFLNLFINSRIGELNLLKTITKDEKEKEEIGKQITELEKVKIEISELTNSKNVYTFDQTEGDSETGSINVEKNIITMHITDKSSAIHELTHAYQFETGRLSFTKDGTLGGSLYDFSDEKEAYYRQGIFLGVKYRMVDMRDKYRNLDSKPQQINGSNDKTTINKLKRKNEIFTIPNN